LVARVFQEVEYGVLPQRYEVDLSRPGTPGGAAPTEPDSFIEQGAEVRSFYVHLDPEFLTRGPRTFTITFATPVLAVLTDDARLGATDALLGARGTVYPRTSGRGPELASDDTLTLSEDRFTLSVTLGEERALDGVRVLINAPPMLEEMP